MNTTRPQVLACALLLLTSQGVGAYPPPPPDPSVPASDVPPAVQQLRRAMMDADLNSLTFHNMEELLHPPVSRAGPVWDMPRADHALDFTVPSGQSIPAAVPRSHVHQRAA